MKKRVWICLMLAAVLALSVCPVYAEEAGTLYEEAPAAEEIVSGDYTYVLLEDGTAKITKYEGQAEFLMIPAALDDHPVTVIGQQAFGGCSAKSVTVPEGVTTLEDYAFKYAQISMITLPDSLASFGANPFWDVNGLTRVVLTDTNTALEVVDNALIAKEDGRLLTIIKGGSTLDNKVQFGDYRVPDGVRVIDDYAFTKCETITSIAFPDTLERIGMDAFNLNTNLVRVTFYQSALTEANAEKPDLVIGDLAFNSCQSLKSFAFPANLKEIGGMAFYGCSALEQANLPDGVIKVGGSAFEGCEALSLVRLPASLQELGWNVFSGCVKLKMLTMGIDVPDNMFMGCTELETAKLNEGVTVIGRNAFEKCAGLTSVTLPASVTDIKDDAFKGCENATFTVIKGTYGEQYVLYYELPFEYAE